MRALLALSSILALGSLAACQRTDQAQGPTGPCARVAERLATFEIGPQATPEQRAPVVARHRAACEAANVTAAEATCLDGARDTWAARACLPKMFPPRQAEAGAADCATIASRLRAAVEKQVGEHGAAAMAAVDRMLPVMTASCEEDQWPASIKQCVAATEPGDMDGFQKCSELLPQDLQDKLAKRMLAAEPPPGAEPEPPPPSPPPRKKR